MQHLFWCRCLKYGAKRGFKPLLRRRYAGGRESRSRLPRCAAIHNQPAMICERRWREHRLLPSPTPPAHPAAWASHPGLSAGTGDPSLLPPELGMRRLRHKLRLVTQTPCRTRGVVSESTARRTESFSMGQHLLLDVWRGGKNPIARRRRKLYKTKKLAEVKRINYCNF